MNYDQRVYVTNSRLPVFDFNTEESKRILLDICANIDTTNELLQNIPSGLTVTEDRLLVDIGSSVSVSGDITVSNFPATQTVDGSVSITNFPATKVTEPVVYNLNYVAEQMYADSINLPIVDNYGRPGWFWGNEYTTGASNAYWYSNTVVPQNQMTKGEMDCIYVILALDRVQPTIVLPFIPIYSLPTGSNDIVPGFAHSRWLYTIPSSHKLNAGEVVMLVIGDEEKVSSVHPELRRIQLQLLSTLGQALDTEIVGLISLNTDSGLKELGAIQYLLQYAGFHYSVLDRVTEYEFNNGVQKEIDSNLTSEGIIVRDVLVQVGISNFPATQQVSGSVNVDNFPTQFSISGDVLVQVGISNFPATQQVSGSVNVDNFPTQFSISGPVSLATGTVVGVTGSVNVDNFPTSFSVSGPVSITGPIGVDANTLSLNQKITLAAAPNNDSILVFVKNLNSISVSGPVSITGPVGVTGSVSVSNFPTQFGVTGPVSVTGSVSVSNFPTQFGVSGPVSITGPVGVTGSVSVSNFPTQFGVSGPVSITGPVGVTGSVSVSNFPTQTSISGPVSITGPVGVTGAVSVENFPTQFSISGPVSITGPVGVTGSVSVSNFPTTQDISGSVSITNTLLQTHDASLNAKIPQLTISGDALKTYLTNDIAVTVPHLNYTTDSVTVSGSVAVNGTAFRNSDLKTFDASLNAQIAAGVPLADGTKIDTHLYASTNGNPNSVHILQSASNGRLYVRLSDGTNNSTLTADGRLLTYDSSVHEHVNSIDTKLSGTIQVKDVSQNYASGRLLVNDISATAQLSDINALLQIGLTTYGKANDVYSGYNIPFLCDASGIQKNFITNFPATFGITGPISISSLPAVTVSGPISISSLPAVTVSGPISISSLPAVTVSGPIAVTISGQTIDNRIYDSSGNNLTSTSNNLDVNIKAFNRTGSTTSNLTTVQPVGASSSVKALETYSYIVGLNNSSTIPLQITSTTGDTTQSLDVQIQNGSTTNDNSATGINVYQILPKVKMYTFGGFDANATTNGLIIGSATTGQAVSSASFNFGGTMTFWAVLAVAGSKNITVNYVDASGELRTSVSTPINGTTATSLGTFKSILDFSLSSTIASGDALFIGTSSTVATLKQTSVYYEDINQKLVGAVTIPNGYVGYITNLTSQTSTASNITLNRWNSSLVRTSVWRVRNEGNIYVSSGYEGALGGILTAGDTLAFSAQTASAGKSVIANLVLKSII